MKNFKRFTGLLLVLTLLLTTFAPVFAATTGSITINGNDSFELGGREFKAYKILDVTGGGETVAYSVPEAMQIFFTDYFDITGVTAGTAAYNQAVTSEIEGLRDDSTGMEAFAKAALAAAKIAELTAQTATGTAANQAVFSGIPLGYYVIEDTTVAGDMNVVSAVMIDTTNPDAEIDVKATLPTLEKEIDEGIKAGDSAIGDDINFTLTSKVPDMTGYTRYYFVIQDTMSAGLDFEGVGSIKVGTETLTAGEDYTVETTNNEDGSTSIRILFTDFLQYKNQKDAAIEVKYTAILNDEAAIGTANDNSATLVYSNNPNYDYEGNKDPDYPDDPDKYVPEDPNYPEKPPVGETPESKTETYTTSLTINKTDGDNALTGASFRIEGEGLNLVIVTNEDGSTTVDTTETDVYAEGAVDVNGKLTFAGLPAGTYTITETLTPDGYNGIDPITLVITFDAESKTFTATADGETIYNTDNLLSVEIVNNSGTLLPGTGGIGTTIFYIVGLTLVIGAAILLVTKKRMSTEN